MAKLKSERHHWWPETVSQHWNDEGGCAHWLRPDGTDKAMPAKNLGVIGNGHHVKLGLEGESTGWDHSFEDEFSKADAGFPKVIEWLNSLEFHDRRGEPISKRFVPQHIPDEILPLLIEGIVSLAVRSPKTRETGVSLAEKLRGDIPPRERNVLIGSNLRGVQRRVVENIGGGGKIGIIYSPDREFIFGDGFFHNIYAGGNAPLSPTMMVPLLPRISVLYARPMQYRPDPLCATNVFSADEAEDLNKTVQVYARNALYYRSEKPEIIPDFARGAHRVFKEGNHLIEQITRTLPGVPPRDLELDRLLGLYRQAD